MEESKGLRVLRILAIPIFAVVFLLGGAVVIAASRDRAVADLVWLAGLLLLGLPVVWRTVRQAFRGHFATDIVATLAIVASALLAQPLAGLIVVLMQTGGEALERYAEGRASDAVRKLEEDSPRLAHRIVNGGVETVPVADIRRGDLVLVRPGEMIPCDGVVANGASHIDTSRLTGESIPVSASSGTEVMSGSLNIEGAFELRVTAPSSESQYARIVEMVRLASASKAPLQRLADRYAVWFTPAVLLVCALTWLVSRDQLRVLAVLVVATPCPLILATPVAIIGGINRAARRQIIMKTGGALEQLSSVRAAIFDKTGTLTMNRPRVTGVAPVGSWSARDVLRYAASLEQHSGHALARVIVDAAREHDLMLAVPTDTVEQAGSGISGRVENHAVAVGGRKYIAAHLGQELGRDSQDGLRSLVAIDGALAGAIELGEHVRAESREVISSLHSLGVRRVLLLSGDHAPNVSRVAAEVGIDEAMGDLLPAAKLERVAELSRSEGPVLMVGDGTNDAPAMSGAAVGVALAGHGGGVTAEAADVLILNDDLGRVVEAITISRRTMRIARESIWVGLGLSGAAMIAAAFGYITPVFGAMLQEAIDVAVIVNALRASTN